MTIFSRDNTPRVRHKRTLFPFTAADRDSARLFLNRMATEGWELEAIRSGGCYTARFRATERTDLRYDVDVTAVFPLDMDKEHAYDNFLAQAGWLLAGQCGSLKCYASAPGAEPAPIQTDPELEQERYRRKVRRPSLIFTLIAVPVLLLVLVAAFAPSNRFHPYLLFGSNGMLFFCLAALVSLTLSFAAPGVLRALKRLRPVSPEQALRRLLLNGRIQAAATALLVVGQLALYISVLCTNTNPSTALPPDALHATGVIAADELVPGAVPSNYGKKTANSLFLRGGYVQQFFEDAPGQYVSFYQERLEARFVWLARWAADGSKGFAHTLAGREAIFPSYESVELGFDESWLARVEGVNSLIIRQGTTVLILEGRIDFTTPDVLALLREEVSS